MNDVNNADERLQQKEVIHHKAPYGYPFNTGACPICLTQLDEGDCFCRICGQAITWGDNEKEDSK